MSSGSPRGRPPRRTARSSRLPWGQPMRVRDAPVRGRCSMMRTMKLRHEISYDAPLADVYAMLADPDFRQASADRHGRDLRRRDDHARRARACSVRIDQVQPTEGVPGFAKKFAGETTRAVQTEEWDSPAGGTITIETPGKPTSISGHPDAERDRRAHHRDAGRRGQGQGAADRRQARVPDGRPGRAGMDKEQGAGAAWLAGRAPMKKVSEELRYDGATLEQVHEMLADPGVPRAGLRQPGLLRHTVQIERRRRRA